jgi:transcription antitermination protein NusB
VRRPDTKRRARALQLLYAWDLLGHPPLDTVVERVAEVFETRPRAYQRAVRLAARAVADCDRLDADIAEAAEHWRLERVAVVEKNILRLALAEIEEGKAPPRGVIDEAVELARWFGGPKAPAFVNGVLDAIARSRSLL